MAKMTKSKQQKIDNFIKELEIFVDLRYKINKETDLCNHSYVVREMLLPYKNSKLLLEETIEELLDINSEE
jgi:hypothetical protein